MASTYTPTLAATKALDAVRLEVGDTNMGKPLLDDEEIAAFLARFGLTKTSDPLANVRGVLRAAAQACRVIAALLAQKSEIVIGQFGAVKATSSREYQALAKALEARAAGTAKPHFFNPSSYDVTHVAGVDADPAEE